MNWIFKTKTLYMGPREAYMWQEIQNIILKNNEGIYIPIEYIIESNGLQSYFNINYDLFWLYLKNKLL